MKNYLTIQYFRGFAALAVVVFHVSNHVGKQFLVGAAGVDVFFVISGFIMWTVTKREATPLQFASRRLIRIVPMYWLATLTIVVLAAAPFHLGAQALISVANLLESLLFIPYYDTTGHIYPVLIPGWTLLYEMFFYLVFTIALFFNRRHQAIVISLALGLLVAAGLLFHPTMAGPAIYTNPLLLEFLAGTWIAMLAERVRFSATQAALLVSAALLAFAAGALLKLDVDAWRIVVWGLPAAALVLAAVGYEQTKQAPNLPIAKHLGDASYSIYLFHGLAIFWAWRLPHIPEIARGPLAIVLAVVFGVTLYRFVETPLNKWARARKWAFA